MGSTTQRGDPDPVPVPETRSQLWGFRTSQRTRQLHVSSRLGVGLRLRCRCAVWLWRVGCGGCLPSRVCVWLSLWAPPRHAPQRAQAQHATALEPRANTT